MEVTQEIKLKQLLLSTSNVESVIATNLEHLKNMIVVAGTSESMLAIVDHIQLLAKVVTVNALQANKLEARVSALEKQGNSPQPKLVAIKLEFMGMETTALAKELH